MPSFSGFAQGAKDILQYAGTIEANRTRMGNLKDQIRQVQAQARWQLSRLRMYEGGLLGTQRFMLGRGGLANVGTAKTLQEATRKEADLESQQLVENALAQIRMLQREYKSTKKANMYNKAGTVISTIGSIF